MKLWKGKETALPTQNSKPTEKWIRLLTILGGGNAVLRDRGKQELISPWHDNCPTECMPCRCEISDYFNKGIALLKK